MKRRSCAVLAICALTAIAGSAKPTALADVTADSGSEPGLAACEKVFATTDPAGLWRQANGPGTPPVRIETTDVDADGAGTGTSVVEGQVIIYWDPSQVITKDGITASPCEVLYHELQHAADDGPNGLPRSELDQTCNGVKYAEWRAVAAENMFRRATGLGDRKAYNGGKVGPGSFQDCRKQEQQNNKKKGSNSAFGDPHITTTDGLIYDVQQVGEFTAYTSDAADAPKVQIRTAPVPDSQSASMVTAAAAGTGDEMVAFVVDNGQLTISHGAKHEAVTIDRGSTTTLPGGVTVSAAAAGEVFVGNSYTVHWPDGSELYVDESGFWGLRVSFAPSDKAKGDKPRGLFGTLNGDPADDLTRPDGRVVPVNSPDDVIRSQFGDAWRISQSESLFPYSPGQSTDTFTNRAFPVPPPPFSPAVTDQARQVCTSAGVIGDAILAACVFDVSTTGNPALAGTAAQVSREQTITAVAGEPLNAKGFGPGLSVSGAVHNDQPVTYEFTAKAGQVADIRSVCTPAGKNIRYTISSSTGSFADPIGGVDGCTDLGRVAFAGAGSYQLVITGDGQYGISWRTTPGDIHRNLNQTALNAGHVNAATRHYLAFTVTPGQTWTFTPDGICNQVNGFEWSVVDASGALNDRGIYDACDPMGPLSLAPGQYSVRIQAGGTDADYHFTVKQS
ncbi:hypothetical protein A5621_17450 [Mycobacterium colombiense]|uniref:VWD domain-containing protein n=1 Tax=Mycobacterium colombiense TaxID=339268 RepID=UPI0007FFAE6C|nr:VWD domain-containing protein [Mycobacterium colombiense]OBJ35302.1 hypothetical protein A5621_17450 [Mycobacterium colombiense]